MKKNCLEILKQFEFDENNCIIGNHIPAILGSFKEKKESNEAMKFVDFQLEIAKESGKDEALKLESPFDEEECISQNRVFLFENMPNIEEVQIMINTSNEA